MYITLSFEVHQPIRFRRKIGNSSNIFEKFIDDEMNKYFFNRIANKCYFKANNIILELIDNFKKEKKKFKVSFSFSGTFLESAERYNKDVLESFKELAKRKKYVEIIAETYYHSLASIYEDASEFIEQVEMNVQAIKDYFGRNPKTFINTEMIFNNRIAKIVEELGFKAIFTEGTERILQWRSPNYVYVRKYCFEDDPEPSKRIKILLRNYRLSDDIAFRFSARDWDQWPLTADKYAAWLAATPGQVINIYIDYETFGEHHWEESGIFWFLKALPYYVNKYNNLEFALPSEVIKNLRPVGEYDVFEFNTISWADTEKDLSAWIGNKMQQTFFEEIKKLEKEVKSLNDEEILKTWRYFQQSDFLYYMCIKGKADNDVHQYFNPYGNVFEVFSDFMSLLAEFKAIIRTRGILKEIKELLKIKEIEMEKNELEEFKRIC
jgi:alpha-amylase